jgi:hypothetical protein
VSPAEYAAGAAPQPAQAPKKKKTWLWVLLALVGLGLVGCIVVAVVGGALFAGLFGGGSPSAAIEAINQAALDGDRATFDKHFDADSIVRLAYPAFLDYLKTTPEYKELVDQLGEEAADQVVREEIMPEDQFVEQLSAEFDIDSLGEGEVPFPEYTISNTSIENNTAEVTLTTIEDGEEVTYVLGMVKETYNGESVWRVKEIKNITDFFNTM